jgi:hypothetical protein
MRTSQIFNLILVRSQSSIEASYDGLEHGETILQLPGKGNCMNWVLGHIAIYRDAMLGAIGKETYMQKSSISMYGYGSDPIIEGSPCVDLINLKEMLEKSYAVLQECLKEKPECLTYSTPDGLIVRKGENVVEHFAHLWGHESIHVGELSALRELALVKMGKGWK